MAEIEVAGVDVNTIAGLAQSRCPAASLSAVIGGELDGSLRQRELRAPNGFGDQLRVVLLDGTTAWGALTLLRASERRPFTPAERSSSRR